MQRSKSKIIREFILEKVVEHPSDISAFVAEKFGISRQAASRHVSFLVENGALEASGNGRSAKYELKEILSSSYDLSLETLLEEDVVWSAYVKPIIAPIMNDNARQILNYGFTEIFNNVLDHSEGTMANITVSIYANKIKLKIKDNGIGIFQKIQVHFGLEDPRHALLELAKGKLTSDPERHTGEGIFFASRMFDCFLLWSHFLSYVRRSDDDWLFEDRKKRLDGTYVSMEINPKTSKTAMEIFDKYAGEADDYGFTRTHVPVNLALYEGETLISRSQAKRLLARVDKFREVWLDFKDVKSIGPAFADEIFRVFAKAHPSIRLYWTNANEVVEKMIARAMSNKDAPATP